MNNNKNKHDDTNDRKMRHGWIRIWAILIPTWIVSLVAVWFLVDELASNNFPNVINEIVSQHVPGELPSMAPASGPAESPPDGP